MFRLVLLLSLVLVSLSLKLPNFNANKVVKKTNEIEIIKPDYKVPIGLLYNILSLSSTLFHQ